ncbi:MAG TPA: TIGR02757 family protein [Acidobacteriota bacterium]|nr:TIGR02757 family protein [Acidobacteriota bacterium]HNT17321.1 TIGR02757 family protein [Acidobacteriota bacterium]HPA26384.1 TIGR02757 family protein [Acidobacteriota bacterium]HQO19720.1 TIGR02757 family protein [Acidobacteriota bacterium]HQQ46366.1 TIGR02757 family protein [Acidobacteriota bacterium]
MKIKNQDLTPYLDRLYKEFGRETLYSDPLQFPRRYKSRKDREASALISAFFAYGRVGNIIFHLEKVHAFLGRSPHRGLLEGKEWKGGAYRFQTEKDICWFLLGLAGIYQDHGSVENLFRSFDGDAETKLRCMADEIRNRFSPLTRGLDHLVSMPSDKSPAKRWRLFLRWVVREDDGLDLGIWKALKPCDLVVPLDTHIAKMAQTLKFTKRKSRDLRFAIDVTEKLREICPEDPLKYDFALVRPGILDNYFKKEK